MVRQGLKTAVGLIVMLLAVPAMAEEYAARLSRVPVDSRTQSSIAGLGHATAELDGDRLRIQGDFSGMLGAATMASLRIGPAVGVRGPVIDELKVTHTADGTLSGAVRLTPEQVAALRSGRLYIQVHSESAPDGNLWGWLLSED